MEIASTEDRVGRPSTSVRVWLAAAGLGVVSGLASAYNPLSSIAVTALAAFCTLAYLRPEAVVLVLLALVPLDLYLTPSGAPGFFLSQAVCAGGFVVVV